MSKAFTTEEFIEKSIKIHGTKYNYNLVEYKNSHTKIEIICPIHGNFYQSPTDHIYQKSGCNKCGEMRTGLKRRNSLEDFINKSNKIHNNKYDYSKVIYKTCEDKVIIICQDHGEFEQTPSSHIRKSGCPICGLITLKIQKTGNKNPQWKPNRELIRIKKKIHRKCRGFLYRSLQLSGNKKEEKTEMLLGYSKKQLLEHLQKDPNFDKWKNDTYNYHIDHIFPVKAFAENGIIDPKIINKLNNIQILTKRENLKKKDRYNKEEFKNYLISEGII